MAEPDPNSTGSNDEAAPTRRPPAEGGANGGEPPRDRPPGGEPSSDAGQSAAVAAEHPKGRTAPLPPEHPSHGTIDEGGDHR
jgi:hypothetical protein